MRRIRRVLCGLSVFLLFCAAVSAAEARIVSLSPAVTELVCRLGRGGRLVGRSEVCNYPEEVKTLPAVGRYADPNLEKLVRLRPTLVLTNDLRAPRVGSVLEKLGAKLIVKQCRNVREYREWVELLGDELDCRREAAAELARFDREIAGLRELKPLSLSPWVTSIPTTTSTLFVSPLGDDRGGWGN